LLSAELGLCAAKTVFRSLNLQVVLSQKIVPEGWFLRKNLFSSVFVFFFSLVQAEISGGIEVGFRLTKVGCLINKVSLGCK